MPYASICQNQPIKTFVNVLLGLLSSQSSSTLPHTCLCPGTGLSQHLCQNVDLDPNIGSFARDITSLRRLPKVVVITVYVYLCYPDFDATNAGLSQ